MKKYDLQISKEHHNKIKLRKKKFLIVQKSLVPRIAIGDILELHTKKNCISGSNIFMRNRNKNNQYNIISARAISIMTDTLYNCDEVLDSLLVMYGGYDLREVKEELNRDFQIDYLREDHIIIELKIF
ncbi:hypothetical protein NE301_03230 [Lactococcus lactis]|uniref:hypothetical protein n=1 Tax=Lactococcus lactis TaxID=1358 RepID=UPI00071C25DF|nr:hypothetical protein [Lactococcus lactis]MCM6841227.1 hypothetical protein [Lactococcus lactis]MCM6847780.1 hypothetical protein [Lactococcus lactis]MCM6851901.1 hypothetical protein [Lactococcus lactis]MCM6859905.1 hypothetical protein [Lactococcus lactis]